MSRQNISIFFKLCAAVLITLCLAFPLGFQPASAAPINGKIVNVTLPNGSIVQARVWGDEYFQHAESLDGYTLMVDKTGWIYYAQISVNGSALVSTGIRYTGSPRAKILLANGRILPKGLRISARGIARQVQVARHSLHADLTRYSAGSGLQGNALGAAPQGNVLGLSLLIDFPDVQSTLFASEMQNFLNQPGYTNFGNKGSLRDFYYDISGGRVIYTQSIFRFTAAHNKSYYTDPNQAYASRAVELIRDGLVALQNTGFNFSTLTTNSSHYVLAINAFYAGGVTNAWGQGIWPHQGWLSPTFTANGVTMEMYQISGVDTSITLGTAAHENGHMLAGCPDTYDYDGSSAGTGNFDLMSGGTDETNPLPPDPYCRVVLAGWGSSTQLNNYANLAQVTATAGSLTPYRWDSPLSTEFFMLENIRKTGRWASMADEGLIIWHIETVTGSNYNEQMTASQHYVVSVEQADGAYHLEHNTNGGGANDLFHSGNKDVFNASTVPNSNWWSGAASGLDISGISAVGDTLTFTLHTAGGPTATVTRTPTPGFTPTKTVTLTPSRTPTAGISPTPSAGASRTITPTPSRTPTAGISPTGTITSTPTRTMTAGITPTRTMTPTITPTGAGACSPVTSTITAPFTYDGAGAFCWQSTNLGAYVNSWNLTSLTLNGANYTNLYVAAGSYPAKINGYWYVSYNSAVSYGHFEAK